MSSKGLILQNRNLVFKHQLPIYCRVLRNHLIQSPHLTDEDTQIQGGGAVLLRITQAVDVLSARKPHHMQLLILTEL